MIALSDVYAPKTMHRGNVFSARQYPRQAFADIINPVLNVDWFEMRGPTFPAHPHAGFSAVTYLFSDSPNGFLNRDSLGQVHHIHPGGLHWSRASRGMLHEETPITDKGAVRGLQIFINLPEANQNDEAAAFALPAEQIAVDTGEGWTSRMAVNGTSIGRADNALPASTRIEEITLAAEMSRSIDMPENWGGLLIVLSGEIVVENYISVTETAAIGFASRGAESFSIRAIDRRARIALIAGEQLNQSIVAHGPLMLATQETLLEAQAYVAQLSIPRIQH